MARHWRTGLDPALYPDATDLEPGGSGVAWSAIWAGTIAAMGVTLILLSIGSGFGLMEVSPWPGMSPKVTSFSLGAGIWLIVTQWVSSTVGGYIAGRLRTRWHSVHTDEVFFRDTAHGLITWATATVITVGIAVLMATLTGLAAAGAVDANVSREAADHARKAAATAALITGVSMLVGAFIAAVAAAIGGQLRDRHP